jgi:hypothetical protein
MKPEHYLTEADSALDLGQWDKAVAYSATGLLSLAIGAMIGLSKAADANE